MNIFSLDVKEQRRRRLDKLNAAEYERRHARTIFILFNILICRLADGVIESLIS